MNLNTELFKRYAPTKKMEFVKKATQQELLSLRKATIERMVKEAGSRIDPNHVAKILYIDKEIAHNDRNSSINCIYQGKKRNTLYLDVYIQGYDTDTEDTCSIEYFLENEEIAKFEEIYSHGSSMIHAYYHEEDKARVLKAICIAYIENKYKDKLNNEEN